MATDNDTGGSLDVLDRELEKLLEDDNVDEGDHDKFSHYVPKDKILESAVRRARKSTKSCETSSR